MLSGVSAFGPSPLQVARQAADLAEASAAQALAARTGPGDAGKGATELVKESLSQLRASAAARAADRGPGQLLDIQA